MVSTMCSIIGIHVPVYVQPAPHLIGHILQVADVLIAITNIAGQHPLNQARLASLAEPLTEALASVLQALPPLASASTAVVTFSQPDHPHQQQDEQQQSVRHEPSRQISTMEKAKIKGDVPIEVHPQAGHVTSDLTVSESQPADEVHKPSSYAAAATPARSGSHQAGITAAVSALSAQLKPTRPASALTAQLQSPQSAETSIKAHPAASGDTPSSPISFSHTPQISLGGAAAALSRPESPLGCELPESSQQLEPSQPPDSPQQPAASQAHQPSHAHGSSEEERMQHQEEVRLARHFAFHVLMLLPAEVIKKRAGFWLQHVDGVPDLLHCCVRIATLQDPQVRSSCPAGGALKLQSY